MLNWGEMEQIIATLAGSEMLSLLTLYVDRTVAVVGFKFFLKCC